ncbi:MAG: hypothetical protein ACOC2Q_03565 [Spirochaetota bacterium]
MDDIRNLMSRMTLEEKASLCSGRDFWTTKPLERVGIHSVTLTDGVHSASDLGTDLIVLVTMRM